MGGRCVCGRSARYPLCDGSHGEEWSCTDTTTAIGHLVVAGPHLSSLAERLAHTLGGRVLHDLAGPVRATHCLVLSDGTDLPALHAELARVTAGSTRGVTVDVPAAVLQVLVNGPVASARPDDPKHLWRAVQQALRADSQPVAPLCKGFLSHAAVDEARLMPILHALRTYAGAELFLCADSIPAGGDWRTSIEHALRGAERFVFIGTVASFASTYCAFEFGLATALELPIRIVRVDDVPLPSWMGHIQAMDLPRRLTQRPWLRPDDALEEAMLECLDPETS